MNRTTTLNDLEASRRLVASLRSRVEELEFLLAAEKSVHASDNRHLLARVKELETAATSLLWLYDGNSSVEEKRQALQSLRDALHARPTESKWDYLDESKWDYGTDDAPEWTT